MDKRIQAFIDAVRARQPLSFEEAKRIFSVSRRTVYNYVHRSNEELKEARIVIDHGWLRYQTVDGVDGEAVGGADSKTARSADGKAFGGAADTTARGADGKSRGGAGVGGDGASVPTNALGVASAWAPPRVAQGTVAPAIPAESLALQGAVRPGAPAISKIPSGRAGRVTYLLRSLLAREDWVTIDELAAQLFITRRTISSDLREVEQELARFDLTLEKRPRYGLRVSGSEMMRRLCLVRALDDATSTGILHGDDDIAPAVSVCVGTVLEETGFSINVLALQSLLAHLAVAVLRARRGAFVSFDPAQLERIAASREYPVAERIAQALGHELHVTLPVEEIAYIAINLAGRQSLYDIGDTDVVISDEVWDVVLRMLNRVFEAYRVDFSGDLELRMNLARHIVPLAVRLHYHMRLDNPLLDDVRMRFPLAFSMAVDASAVLAEQYGERPSDEEVGYLAMAFILALDRKSSGVAKKRVLVVCVSGASTARLLKDRCEREFAERNKPHEEALPVLRRRHVYQHARAQHAKSGRCPQPALHGRGVPAGLDGSDGRGRQP